MKKQLSITGTSKRATILISLGLMIMLLGIAFASAESIGTFKQRTTVTLPQLCATCTSNNITNVQYPNGTIIVSNIQMTKTGSWFNYTIAGSYITEIGTYSVNGIGDLDGVDTVWAYTFDVTPSGFVGTLGFYIIILLLSAGVIVLGFSKDDPVLVILGSFGLYFVGLYILFNGIDGLKDPVYTWALGIIVLMIAAYISVRSAYELVVNANIDMGI